MCLEIKSCTSTELFFTKTIAIAMISLCQSSNRAASSIWRGNICGTCFEYRGGLTGRANLDVDREPMTLPVRHYLNIYIFMAVSDEVDCHLDSFLEKLLVLGPSPGLL